jgi:hypothetical protein
MQCMGGKRGFIYTHDYTHDALNMTYVAGSQRSELPAETPFAHGRG